MALENSKQTEANNSDGLGCGALGLSLGVTKNCHRVVIALAAIVVAAAWEAVIAKKENTSIVATTPTPTPIPTPTSKAEMNGMGVESATLVLSLQP